MFMNLAAKGCLQKTPVVRECVCVCACMCVYVNPCLFVFER